MACFGLKVKMLNCWLPPQYFGPQRWWGWGYCFLVPIPFYWHWPWHWCWCWCLHQHNISWTDECILSIFADLLLELTKRLFFFFFLVCMVEIVFFFKIGHSQQTSVFCEMGLLASGIEAEKNLTAGKHCRLDQTALLGKFKIKKEKKSFGDQ